MRFSHLEQCGRLSQPDLEAAVTSRDECAALLARMSDIAVPGTGAAAVISVFAAIASDACDWLEGDLVVEMVEDDEVITVSAVTDLGGDTRQDVVSPFVLKVPLTEILAAIERTPKLVGTLKLRRISWRRIKLSTNEELARSNVPPRL
jgi:hypothetical protein